jgi:DNA polymerase-1
MEVFVARSEEQAKYACERLSKASALGCDTETSGLSAKHGKLYSIQFSDGEFNALVPLSEGVGMGGFSRLLADEGTTKIFHNARFDLEFLRANGCSVANVFDTMIAEKVLTRGANQSASLAETLYRYFAIDLEKSHRAKFTRRWDGVWTPELVNYALSDVIHLPALMLEQTEWMTKLDLRDEYERQMLRVTSGDMPGVPL